MAIERRAALAAPFLVHFPPGKISTPDSSFLTPAAHKGLFDQLDQGIESTPNIAHYTQPFSKSQAAILTLLSYSPLLKKTSASTLSRRQGLCQRHHSYLSALTGTTMAKRGQSKANQGGPKKSLIGKKVEINKLIEANKAKPTSPPHIRSPQRPGKSPPRTQSQCNAYSASVAFTRFGLEPVISSLPGAESQDYLIFDQRCLEKPEIALVRLPCEPSVKRSLRYQRKGHFPFLRLPGELRNKIYDYAIAKGDYAIDWIDHNQKNKSLTYGFPKQSWQFKTSEHSGPILLPGTAQRRRSLDFHHRRSINQHLSKDDIRLGPATLLLVCKQMSEEAASVLYSKCMFYFSGLRALRFFLDHLRPATMKSIRKIALTYRAYGNPLKSEHQQWKEKHDRLWETLCWRIADNCPLTKLQLNLTLNKSPMSFVPFDSVDPLDLGAQWIRPLWAFQDAGIKHCWGRIWCASQSSAVLEVESWKMRKEILGDEWDEEIESTRNAFGREKKKPGRDEAAKKLQVLRLTVDGAR